MDSIYSGKRITLKRTRPNPLFQTWLEELHEEAKQKRSKHESMLSEALTSIAKYPLPLQSGFECAILNGFDKRLCMFIDKKLQVYYNRYKLKSPSKSASENDIIIPSKSVDSSATQLIHTSPFKDLKHTDRQIEINRDTQSNTPIEFIESLANNYKPAYRSGGYALLIALLKHTNNNENQLDKAALIRYAQKYCDDAFTARPESIKNAWADMDILISKQLVNKNYELIELYSLTDKGISIAKELLKNCQEVSTIQNFVPRLSNPEQINIEQHNTQDNADLSANSSNSSHNSVDSLFDTVELEPNSFEIVLLIDKMETNGAKKKDDLIIPANTLHEYRSLKVGDYTWVAKHKFDSSKEIVLPYIIERKRMDDFAASIKDGRFHEQKFRLRRSGIENIIYLVENYGMNKNVGLPMQSLMQALANTRMADNFTVHITKSLAYTIRFLAMMTKRLACRYIKKHLKGWNAPPEKDTLMTFKYFNKCSMKNKSLTVKEMFIKMLLQLKGVSAEKAVAIASQYKTPRRLINAYKYCDQKEGEMLLANLKYGTFSRNVGPTVSKTIFQLFSKATM